MSRPHTFTWQWSIYTSSILSVHFIALSSKTFCAVRSFPSICKNIHDLFFHQHWCIWLTLKLLIMLHWTWLRSRLFSYFNQHYINIGYCLQKQSVCHSYNITISLCFAVVSILRSVLLNTWFNSLILILNVANELRASWTHRITIYIVKWTSEGTTQSYRKCCFRKLLGTAFTISHSLWLSPVCPSQTHLGLAVALA